MKIKVLGLLGFCLLSLIIIPHKLNTALSYNCSRRIRANDSEYQLNRTISMISQLEKGTFPLNSFKSEDAIYAVLDFLKRPDAAWEMKEKLLQWMPGFFNLLSPKQQQVIRKEFKTLDQERYQRQLAQRFNSINSPAIVFKFQLPFLYGADPLIATIGINSTVEMALLGKVDQHPFSKYLP